MNHSKEHNITDLYAGPRGIAVKVLNRIFKTDAYLDKLIDSEMKNIELSGKDKALLFEIVHGVIRWSLKLDWILTGFYKGQYSKLMQDIKTAMKVALYQLLFLDKVPEYAAINEAVEFVKKLQGKKSGDMTNAVLRNILRNKENIRYPDKETDLVNYLSVVYSHPVWLVKRWLKQFGEDFTSKLMESNNERPKLYLRLNKLKTSKSELITLLDEVDVKYKNCAYFDEFLELKSISNITDWEYFKKGYFNIQDEATGFGVKLLDVKASDRVLDMCSAPGGKTSFLAAEMDNEGEIVAIDLHESRIKILEQNLERLGVKNVKTVAVDTLKFKDEEKFTKILADVPCSGLGTITKKPDIKWKRMLSDLYEMPKLQFRILEKGASLLRVGGEIVYSTCSIDREENIDIVNKFLEKYSNFELINASYKFDKNLLDSNGCVQIYPHIHNIDGAFAAKIRKIK